ncbi:MAG: hypothetical protein J3K34DRAFT_426474 [Monoraphidium minutum]|nr:MAG: hypothetical protein J3K34DRAFT_426474 [Monoraphidium minutum]
MRPHSRGGAGQLRSVARALALGVASGCALCALAYRNVPKLQGARALHRASACGRKLASTDCRKRRARAVVRAIPYALAPGFMYI